MQFKPCRSRGTEGCTRTSHNYVKSGKLNRSMTESCLYFAHPDGFGTMTSLISDVRKWLDEKTEYFALPDLDAEPLYGALPPLGTEVRLAQ